MPAAVRNISARTRVAGSSHWLDLMLKACERNIALTPFEFVVVAALLLYGVCNLGWGAYQNQHSIGIFVNHGLVGKASLGLQGIENHASWNKTNQFGSRAGQAESSVHKVAESSRDGTEKNQNVHEARAGEAHQNHKKIFIEIIPDSLEEMATSTVEQTAATAVQQVITR